jgi:amino acid transporter
MTPETYQAPRAFGPPVRVDRPIGELFSELASQTNELVRQEIDLAKTELTHKATYASKHGSLIAAAALLAVVGLLALVAALVLGLATVMALWLSALLVGLAILAIACAVGARGAAGLRRLNPKPQHTIQSLRENKSWAQRQIR